MSVKPKNAKVLGLCGSFMFSFMALTTLLAACGDPTPSPVSPTSVAPTAIAPVTTANPTSPASVTTTKPTSPASPAPGGSTGNASFEPILFVHGNGDYAALWLTTIWRFESNGYPRDRLFALDYPNPNARDDDTVAQPSRSSTEEQRMQLSAKVDEVLAKTGASKLVLIGQSRGGNSIRNYLKNGGGAAKVDKAILAGTPNHGVPAVLPANNEFNGQGPFLKGLNVGNEVADGVAFMTIRSDSQDKYAQPEISPGKPSDVGYAGPELKGAKNVVIPNLDHRETGYSPQAFSQMFQFLTGASPANLNIVPEDAPKLSGIVIGYENKVPTNKGVEGIKVTFFELDPTSGARQGAAAYEATTKADGSWGNFTAKPTAYYEMVVQAPGQPVRHFFRSPFPRSTSYLHLRLFPDDATPGKAVIFFTRPRGYVSNSRDKHLLDGKPVPGVKDGVPTDATFRVELDGPERAVPVSLNNESMVVRAIPGEIVYAEFTY